VHEVKSILFFSQYSVNITMCVQYAKLLNSRTDEQFESVLSQMEADVPTFYAYINLNWLPYKNSVTTFGRRNMMHLSNRTNNRIERLGDLYSIFVLQLRRSDASCNFVT